MVYVAGETHGKFDALSKFSKGDEGKFLSKNDYVIVPGDFGVWHKTLNEIKKLDSTLNFKLLFLDGNHEHYKLLNSFPEKQFCGGKVHDVYGVYHLCRGEVYKLPIEGDCITIAVCGGGDSKDKNMRVEGVTWFPEETISNEDVENLFYNVKNHTKIDYFISHSLSAEIKSEWNYKLINSMFPVLSTFEMHESDFRIRDIVSKLKAGQYISAHEHVDREFLLNGKKYRCVYRDFVKLEKTP